MMHCRDVRQLMDSFLTGQLLVETNHEVVRHLETCRECRAEVAGRRALRDKLREAFTQAEELRPRPEFTAELTARLRPPHAGVSRRSLLRSWWALAAGVALATGGALVVRDSSSRSRLRALAQAAAGDHRDCAVKFSLAERPIPLDEAGRRYGAPYAALATLQLSGIDPALEMVERHACVYQGRRFGHVVLRYHGTLASLLIIEGEPPTAPQLEFHDGKPEVASFSAGSFVGFIVADADGPKVLRLAETLAGPLSRHIA